MKHQQWRKMVQQRVKDPVTWGEFLYVLSIGIAVQVLTALFA